MKTYIQNYVDLNIKISKQVYKKHVDLTTKINTVDLGTVLSVLLYYKIMKIYPQKMCRLILQNYVDLSTKQKFVNLYYITM